MAKDPAILFYVQDFLIGSSLLSPLQKGHYITLLCYQQQSENGSLSLDKIKTLMRGDFSKHWPVLMLKFQVDDNGYYNDRMRQEIEKRKKFSNKQKEAANKRWQSPGNATALPRECLLENENEVPAVEKGVQGEKQPIIYGLLSGWMHHRPAYPQNQAQDFPALFQIGQFIADQLKRQWIPASAKDEHDIKTEWQKLSAWLSADDFYSGFSLTSISKTSTLQTIWQKSKQQKNGTHQQPPVTGNRKSAGAVRLVSILKDEIESDQPGECYPTG